jgi:predicted transcriptional regulator
LGYISETDAEKYKRLFDAESKRKEELLQINAKLNDEKALLQRQLKKKKRK